MEKGKFVYVLPEPIGLIDRIMADTTREKPDGFKSMLRRVSPEEMNKMHERFDGDGFPDCVAEMTPTELRIWPRPDEEGELLVMFYPPVKVV